MTIFEWLHKSIPLTWSEYLTRQVLHWHPRSIHSRRVEGLSKVEDALQNLNLNTLFYSKQHQFPQMNEPQKASKNFCSAKACLWMRNNCFCFWILACTLAQLPPIPCSYVCHSPISPPPSIQIDRFILDGHHHLTTSMPTDLHYSA